MQRKTKIGAVVAALALAGGGVAYASIPDSGGVIHGCRNNTTGMLKVIDDSSQSCASGTTALNWNQAGAAGPVGPQGEAGPTGPTGPSLGVSYYIVSASQTNVAAGTLTDPLRPQCDSGDHATGGGYGGLTNTDVRVHVLNTQPLFGTGVDPIGWDVRVLVVSGPNTNVYAYAVCSHVS